MLSRLSSALHSVSAARIGAALVLASLQACGSSGGGASNPGSSISAGTGCDLQYTLTDLPALSGADPLLGQQWHLNNVGQSGGTAGEDIRAPQAWLTSRGGGVRVAVIDDAIELTHPDLQPNVVANASYSFRPGNRGSVWPVPCYANDDDHGTAVAGLILARNDNALGGVGVAPRASLVGYDALSSSTDVDIASALTRDSQLNGIYNNSWGSLDTGQTHPAVPAFTEAIASGIRYGRNGLGSIFVFPGGNGGCFLTDNTTGQCSDDNANLDGYVNHPGVITVCAVNDDGRSPWYAEPGANLLVCAPSSTSLTERPVALTTTALRGGYRTDFSGTSGSTPIVSGVAALMLSANPRLSWRDVRLILAQTARRNDPSDVGWLPSTVGNGFHHKYGYGVVDAAAAVSRATSWTSVGGSDQLVSCGWYNRSPNLPVPDAGVSKAQPGLIDAISVPAGSCPIAKIEFVEIMLTTQHAYTGDLQVDLVSPAGRVSRLADTRICKDDPYNPDACGAYSGWVFGSNRHIGEAATGVWSINLTDKVPADTGRLVSWSLRIHGSRN